MSKIDDIREFIKIKAIEFGAKTEIGVNKSFVERNNTGFDSLNDGGAFFGFIHPDEENSGPFHDFSFTVFPSSDHEPWLVCLGIGTLGFKNDFELATFPGLRRLFSSLVDEDGFCKSDLSDIENSLPKNFTTSPKLMHLRNTINTYTKVLPVCQIIPDPTSAEGKEKITAFLAGYAKLRDWPSNNEQRKAVSKAISNYTHQRQINDLAEVRDLTLIRKYVILQGPPGTGKTRLAKIVASQLGESIFFTQFHAETTYSDFIYGIRPDITSKTLSYAEHYGEFSKALQNAFVTKKKTVLIIDEINRANLANVLGPIFYLFEYKAVALDIEIEVFPGFKIRQLPEDFFVIATMNTADRSLAVVDFALRRRFAWYSLHPQAIDSPEFFKEDFDKFNGIFQWYANSMELNLQPGQGYFFASSEAEMKQRIRFELFPLIREYLQEGLLSSAKEEFSNYFSTRIGKSLFE